MSTLYRGPPIDASYQVSDHLAKRFQRRRIKKSANQKQESPVVAMFVNGSGRNKQSLTLQRDLDKPVQWEQLWKMAFHPDKCNVIKHL